MDYTFQNTLIKRYFDGDNSYVPTSEIIYLHKHPMIRPNFMMELSEMIRDAGELMIKHKLTHYADKLTNIAIRMGKELPDVNDANAKAVLETMREAYTLANELLTKLK